MGLLDDAIREHLELKRRRGADPGEIAHQERAALDPVLSGESEPIADELDEPIADELDEAPAATDADVLGVHDDEPAAPDPAVTLDSEHEAEPSVVSHAGQETAELDMEEVLAADRVAEPADAAPGAPSEDPGARADDSLEWEIPRRGGHEPAPEDTPGQERLSFE